MKKRNRRQGFTLAEIIVVLVILAILAAASIPTYLGFVEKSRASVEETNIARLEKAIQLALIDPAITDAISYADTTRVVYGFPDGAGDMDGTVRVYDAGWNETDGGASGELARLVAKYYNTTPPDGNNSNFRAEPLKSNTYKDKNIIIYIRRDTASGRVTLERIEVKRPAISG